MLVHYVTMLFPFPGETFAASDVRALLQEDVELTVHSLRPRHPSTRTLVHSWGLGPVHLTHGGIDRVLSGLLTALRRPALLGSALRLAAATISRPGMFIRTLALLPRALDIYDLIEREKPDVVHLFWGHYPAIVARLVQRGLPEVVTSVFLGAYDLDWGYPLSRPAALQADLVWTHSRANIPALEHLGVDPDRIRLAYRGLDFARFPEPRPKVEGRIVSVGRLIPSKGMDDVLRTFTLVHRRHPHTTLVIAGDGPEREKLQALAGELGVSGSVEFLGHVEHARVLEELNEAQVMLFLSHKPSERLPNAVKEAMACGCYCVTSATPGIEELIPDEDHGAVAAASDHRLFAEIICEAMAEPERMTRVAGNAVRHVREHFDNRVAMGRYAREWRKLVGAGTRPGVVVRPADLV